MQDVNNRETGWRWEVRGLMGTLYFPHKFLVNLKLLPEKSFLTNILQTVLNKLIRVDMGIKMGKNSWEKILM